MSVANHFHLLTELDGAAVECRNHNFESEAEEIDRVAGEVLDNIIDNGFEIELGFLEQEPTLAESKIIWVGADHPFKKRTAKGREVWLSRCAGRNADGINMSMLRVVGKNPEVAPKEVLLGGRSLRFTNRPSGLRRT